jgi:DNA repair protein RadC
MSKPILDSFKAAEIELVYHNKLPARNRPIANKSEIAYQLFRVNWGDGQILLREQFKVMLLNARCACLGIADIGTGGLTSCVVDQRLIFAAALKGNATSIILAHNHPSGNLNESAADLLLTRRIAQSGNLLDIRVHDHLIITADGYKSFADQGLMPV